MSAEKNLNLKKTSFLSKTNSSFIEQMYLRYVKEDPSLPESWRDYFSDLNEDVKSIIKEIEGPSWIRKNLDENTRDDNSSTLEKQKIDSIKAIALIRSYRIRGHLIANLDPLGMMKREYLHELHPSDHGFKKEDYERKIYLSSYLDTSYSTIKDIMFKLRRVYCATIGAEYMHISDPVEKIWFRERMEKNENQINFTNKGKKAILKTIIKAEGFEKYLAKKFIGTKRFGLDGGEALIPALEQIIKRGGQLGAKEIKIGMPHRGRLNVLANVLQKSYKKIFNEFVGELDAKSEESAGDVKYHLGASSNREFDGNSVHVSLTDNPSHLEAVNPVVLGQVRAKQFFHKDKERKEVIPILIHGDAAFAGQGVVAECFAMSGLKGHNTGGTIHIIVNNQIGFTTSPRFARSSPYPSDLGKIVEAPILHCNGDDPEAVVHCAKIAIEFRQRFKKDVVIDLICYRRFGHNEGDEPTFTQPLMYKKIKSHPTTLNIYSKKLIKENSITEEEFKSEKKEFNDLLENQFKSAKDHHPKIDWFEGTWSRYRPQKGKDKIGNTGVQKNELIEISKKIHSLQENLKIHKTIKRIFENRHKSILEEKNIDWSTAEALAFGTLLKEGFPVRLVGQDSGRGTFSQRHSVLRNQEDNSRYIPLNNISNKQQNFEIVDSFLSELAVLGFEYGYSLVEPETLTIWEAQFGDFANGAQVVIDQFIASGERKWNRASGLVMLLPHGYEGQGPEHSSARLERFLQLSGQENLQIVNCTTPANYFHVLRRQIHRDFRKPLIIMTPKSLLRNKLCISNLEDFSKNKSFHRVLKDHSYFDNDKFICLKKDSDIKKVIICSGKIYFDLLKARETIRRNDIVLIRVEQLYPFPVKSLVKEIKNYRKNASFFWCQEEPKNMGAWSSVRDYIQWTLDYIEANNNKISYIGRDPAASPATGYAKRHISQQEEIIRKVFE